MNARFETLEQLKLAVKEKLIKFIENKNNYKSLLKKLIT